VSAPAAFELVDARIGHARCSGAANKFVYTAGFVLARLPSPRGRFWPLFSRRRPAIFTLLDRDHGVGGRDAEAWARHLLGADGARDLWLLTQPRLFGFLFNPVSFWFAIDREGEARAVLAEVNNTFGERHTYLCRRDDGGPIRADDVLEARKVMRVSPFQRAHGGYRFRFDWCAEAVSVWIRFDDDQGGGMIATLSGPRKEMTALALGRALLRWPLGSLGVAGLIGWQALKLMLKGERYRAGERTKLEETVR
jgi:uncharacterized protein